MKKIQSLIITATFLVATTTITQAETIIAVPSGTTGDNNGFGFSGIHYATGKGSMSGANFSSVTLNTDPGNISFYNPNDLTGATNFTLYLNLVDQGGSLLTLSGALNFGVAAFDLIGTLRADFSDPLISDTTFKFVQGTAGVGGVGNIPAPNGVNNTTRYMSLWGADSTEDNIPNSIGFDPKYATYGIDLVVHWDDDGTTITEISEPASLLLLALGLFGMGATRLRK